nr:hypothetical protein [Tanacetum cinerariifolium]
MPKDPYAYVVAAFQALPPPDYVPGPEEPEQAPPSPVYIPYVSEPVYLEYIPPEDDVFPAEEQPLPAAASPTADSFLSSPTILPIALHAASPPLQLLSSDHRADRPEVTLLPRKRADYGFVNSVEAEIRRQRAEDIEYGIRDTWIDPTDVAEEAEIRRQRAEDIEYGIRDTWIDPTDVAEEGRQTEIFQRVEALVDDSQYHYETGQLVDQEAIVS